MPRKRAPSPATIATLSALLEAKKGLHGYDIMRSTGVSPGTLYPMLIRLEQQGLMTASWEESPEPGRPPRHIYALTKLGVAEARKAISPDRDAPTTKRARNQLTYD